MPTRLNAQDSTTISLIKPLFTKNQSDEEFFDEWKFQKDTSDVEEFFTSYLNSPGFNRVLDNQKQWWKQRHPYKKWIQSYDPGFSTWKWFEDSKGRYPKTYTADMPISLSFSTNAREGETKYPVGVIGTWPDSENPFSFVLGHEYWHGKAPYDGWSLDKTRHFDSKSAQREALLQNTGAVENGHDERETEKHADKQGLIYLLYKDGIYDARSNKDITIEQVKQAREKYPHLRPFLQMTDEQIQFLINTVAHRSNTSSGMLYAQLGGNLNYLNYSK